jgi:hypothetical protein
MTDTNTSSEISKMQNPQTAAARLKKISPLRPALAILPGSGLLCLRFSPLCLQPQVPSQIHP